MSPSPSDNLPWPQPTPPPNPSKRTRHWSGAAPLDHRRSIVPRQVVVNQTGVAEAAEQCQFTSGNDVVSCFPTANSIFPQHEWATFVWNSNLPDFTQTDRVDIRLFHGDSGHQVLEMLDQLNPRGRAGAVTAQVNDTWFPDGGLGWSGTNISYPFYWVITRANVSPNDTTTPQATFTAVQTTYADSVTSSLASVSSVAAASATSVAAISSASVASTRSVASVSASQAATASTPGVSTTSSGAGGLQQDSGSSFPHWAIAVIVVLGFLAIVATCVLIFLIARRVRRNRSLANSRRGSIGSASPMITNTLGGAPQSPVLDQPGMQGFGDPPSIAQRPPSISSPDGASTISHPHSAGEGLFSGADAAIMADAFRKALRKPDFAEPAIEEGDSPEAVERRDAELLSRELAEEGRDIRSVSSSRGVRVETLSDGGGTIHDSPR
ncbi:hypothetical protein HETIRDRAFT_383923 [Heterobasidion irregulare TC 32-1]|uniref:Uncharacterized protein n=1 Tax=Heterobasidion irregulare (strain TC 32-1) TaxID=747525 RepID=W4K6U2_HETIT|nr:uncharacterized protein HETIRDRAFT_383923 [Heterobasidion irregulare TC 32-1]ETW81557.1 hypothetical protein HETIRDRAFT_383923 [Heterobasidion irregulare TC 32-1]